MKKSGILLVLFVVSSLLGACSGSQPDGEVSKENVVLENQSLVDITTDAGEENSYVTEDDNEINSVQEKDADKTEDTTLFTMVESFEPNGVYYMYYGGTGILAEELKLDSSTPLWEYDENSLSITYCDKLDYQLIEIGKGIYEVEDYSPLSSDEVEYKGSFYLFQKGEEFDPYVESVTARRMYDEGFGEDSCWYYGSWDVVDFNVEKGVVHLYRFSEDGQTIESEKEAEFGYLEESDSIVLFDEEGTVEDEWKIVVYSNGTVIVNSTVDYYYPRVLFKANRIPTSIEPSY